MQNMKSRRAWPTSTEANKIYSNIQGFYKRLDTSSCSNNTTELEITKKLNIKLKRITMLCDKRFRMRPSQDGRCFRIE